MSATAVCPRCGEGFHCSATVAQPNDATPCACTTIALDPKLLADLRERYTRCLCLRCLVELSTANRGTAAHR